MRHCSGTSTSFSVTQSTLLRPTPWTKSNSQEYLGPTEMEKAIGYVRVSSKEQEREGFSIPAQTKLIREYALKKGLRLVELVEETETAKRAGRRQFQYLIGLLRGQPDIKHVLVEKTDRLYRNDLEIGPEGREIRFTDVTAESGIVSTGYGM